MAHSFRLNTSRSLQQHDNAGNDESASPDVVHVEPGQRFTELVGEAPMRYLAGWRMQLAKQMMREGAGNVQDVARP